MNKKDIIDFAKDNIFYILGGLCLLIVGVVYILSRGSGAVVIRYDEDEIPFYTQEVIYDDEKQEAALEEVAEEQVYVVVHIVGAVNSPGVFTLKEGSRVYQVLELAGGENEYADLSRINLAAVIQDAMQIIIPAFDDEIEEVFIFAETNEPVIAANPSSGLININTANLAELQTLPGVGPVLAQNIIDFRESHGSFANVDELINVSRIGDATIERLRDLITVN